jgi:hypothetical protein
VFGVAVVLVLPSIALLFSLAQRDIVQETESPQRASERAAVGASARTTPESNE